MDIHKDEAARHGAPQVKAFLVEANMAESEGASIFEFASFRSYLLAKEMFCHCSINSI